MKKFFLASALAMFSFAAAAQMVFPHVWNNRNSVSIDAWNSSDRNVMCWGSIYLELDENRRETLHVNEYIWARGSLYRTYYPMTFGATIQSLSHSVYCN